MSNYFRNLQETIDRQSPNTKFSTQVKYWINGHWRLVGNLVMMFILACICLWGAYIAGEKTSNRSIIETVIPQIQQADSLDGRVENVIRSSQRP
jgi:hypothetical protein